MNFNTLYEKLSAAVITTANEHLKQAPFNKTITARITGTIKDSKLYMIMYAGKEYRVLSYMKLEIGDMVKIIIPNNDFTNMFVVASSSLQRQIDDINRKLAAIK